MKHPARRSWLHVFRRETTANPRAATCYLCPTWFYALNERRAWRKVMRHVGQAHPGHGCGASR